MSFSTLPQLTISSCPETKVKESLASNVGAEIFASRYTQANWFIYKGGTCHGLPGVVTKMLAIQPESM